MQNLNQLIQQQIQQQKQIKQQLEQEMRADEFFAPAMAPVPGQPTAAQKQTTQIEDLIQEEASDVQVHQSTMTGNLQAQQQQYQSDFNEQWLASHAPPRSRASAAASPPGVPSQSQRTAFALPVAARC